MSLTRRFPLDHTDSTSASGDPARIRELPDSLVSADDTVIIWDALQEITEADLKKCEDYLTAEGLFFYRQ